MFRFQHLFLFLAVGYSLILQKRSHRGSPTIVTSSSGSRLVSVSSGWSSVQSFSLHAASNTVEADQEPKVWTSASFRRPLHWVQRVAHLEDTLQFYENNFNFKVYRHEEFSSGCEATCNGPYGGAWSKTMVGPEPGEGESFCLELVYNYGVNKYDRGNDLRTIAIKESAFKGKTSLIEQDPLGRKFIVTPDGHWLNLIESEAASNSKIHQGDSIRSVSLHVSNLASSVAFYEQVLGATVTLSADKISASCSWDPSNESNRKTPTKNAEVNLFQLPEGQAMDFGASQGRFAIETEDGAQKKIASRMLSAQRSGSARIVHGPVKLEPHGEEVLILTDEDGHEYCFVDARGFQKCVDVAKKQVRILHYSAHYFISSSLFPSSIPSLFLIVFIIEKSEPSEPSQPPIQNSHLLAMI
jgi:catechol 2,3-dioxygenase-like lactoylglutathione lyase family enzyme